MTQPNLKNNERSWDDFLSLLSQNFQSNAKEYNIYQDGIIREVVIRFSNNNNYYYYTKQIIENDVVVQSYTFYAKPEDNYAICLDDEFPPCGDPRNVGFTDIICENITDNNKIYLTNGRYVVDSFDKFKTKLWITSNNRAIPYKTFSMNLIWCEMMPDLIIKYKICDIPQVQDWGEPTTMYSFKEYNHLVNINTTSDVYERCPGLEYMPSMPVKYVDATTSTVSLNRYNGKITKIQVYGSDDIDTIDLKLNNIVSKQMNKQDHNCFEILFTDTSKKNFDQNKFLFANRCDDMVLYIKHKESNEPLDIRIKIDFMNEVDLYIGGCYKGSFCKWLNGGTVEGFKFNCLTPVIS
jgi:hypothetical protein